MKSSNTKATQILGYLVITLGLTLLGVFSILFVGSTLSSQELSNGYDEPFINSKYISENINSDTYNAGVTGGEEIVQENMVDEKQGIIATDENRKVVTFERELTESEKKDIEETYGVTFVEEQSAGGIYVLNISQESNVSELSKKYSTTVETDIPVKISADTVDWGISRIGADKVWSTGSGAGIKIAIIDTGVQIDHPDLRANIVEGYDFVNTDNDPNDDNGHGTHVAGIASATLNQSGTIGAGYSAKIMPVKVLNNQGYGYLSDVAKGIYYAADNGARIINLSLGTPSDTYTLRSAITYAANKGVLIIAAAGNDGGAPCLYPAAYSSAVCVMATDSSNQLASFSNIGGEISAPGVSNYSTFVGSSYRYLSGTSMATPHISGAAALLMSICTDCSTSEIRSILRDTAIDLGETGKDILFGYGLVDLVSAVNFVNPPETEEPPIEEEPTQPEEPNNIEQPSTPEPSPAKETKQEVDILNPLPNKGKKYVPKISEDIKVEFTLSPLSESSKLKDIVLTLDNEEIYTTTDQMGEYLVTKDLLNHSQHWLTVTATFSDGTKSIEKIIIDLTYLRSLEKVSARDKSVLGISFSIFDWINIF